MSVLVVGSVAFDTIITPTTQVDMVMGGSASYASLAASRFGPALLVGIAGEDFKDEFVQLYRRNQVDIGGLEIAKGEKTFYWKGKYLENFNDRVTLDTQLNSFEHFHPKVPESHRSSEYVLLGNIQPSLQLEVLQQIKQCKLVMADTMNLWIKTTRDDLDQLVSKVDVLVLNDEEARMYTGMSNLILAAKEIQKKGPRIVIIKKGSHGAMLFYEGDIFSAPAFPLTGVVDPTGAGDSFAGAMMGYLASVNDISPDYMRKALVYGTVCASFTVSDFSVKALDGLSKDKLDQRYKKIEEITRF